MARTAALGLAVAAAVAGLLAAITASPALAVAAGSTSLLAAVAALRALEVGARADRPAHDTRSDPPGRPPPEESDPPAPLAGRDPDTIDLVAAQPVHPPAGRDAGPPLPRIPAAKPDGGVLLTEQFLTTTLRGRVAVARRALRPLSIVCFEVLDVVQGDSVPADSDQVASILHETLREADVAGYLGEHAYVFLLEETGEDGAVWTAERLRRSLAEAASGARRFRAGVASYPSHGLEPEVLLSRAVTALERARDWTRDRIEVASD